MALDALSKKTLCSTVVTSKYGCALLRAKALENLAHPGCA